MVLSLHSNMLYDLNEVSHLVSFTSLKEFSIADNPCVKCFEGQKYPFIFLVIIKLD